MNLPKAGTDPRKTGHTEPANVDREGGGKKPHPMKGGGAFFGRGWSGAAVAG